MDIHILHALSRRQTYNTLRSAVPPEGLASSTYNILGYFKSYWEYFPEHEYIDVPTLESHLCLRMFAALPDEQKAQLKLMCQRLAAPRDEVAIRGVMRTLEELDLQGQAGALLMRYQNGDEVDLAYELQQMAAKSMRRIGQSAPTDYNDRPIADILADIADDRGVKFTHLPTLHSHVKGILGGTSMAIGAPPDKGKTAFCARLVVTIAKQCVELFGADRPILWLNNEGHSDRIRPRLFQAALNSNVDTIVAMSNRGELVPAYEAAIGAPQDYIRLKDIHGMTLSKVEQIIEQMRPCVVIYDMLANVRVPVPSGNKAEAVELAWQLVREQAVTHDFIAISTVQVSADGYNMLFPPYNALKDNKVGIQGATDLIIMLGALLSPDMQGVRGISTPKNKFTVPGKPGYATATVYFDPDTCGFSEGAEA